jgi:hypothetical protein
LQWGNINTHFPWFDDARSIRSTREKQQLPTPHRHHSRPEMDSLPGRSRRYQPSSLLGVPQDLCIEIVAHVSVTSEWPLADLRSLRGTCSTMRRVCDKSDVGRRLSIEGIRDEISWVWNPTSYKAFLAMQTGLGHPEACFHSGIKPFFIEHRGYNISGTPLRVGTMRRPIYTSYFSTETMAVPPPPTPRSGT